MTVDDVGAGDAAGGGGAGDGGAGAAPAAAFYEAFTREDLKTSPTIQKFKDVETLADGYVQLEKRYGIAPERRLDLPVDPEDKDGWRAIWTRLGAPENADDYGLKAPDEAGEADKALVAGFVAEAHGMGLPKPMAEKAFAWFMSEAAKAVETQKTQFEAARAEGEAVLKKEWGAAYDQRAREIGRLLTEHGGDLAKELDGKLGNYPQLGLFLGKMLDRMAEPGAAGGEGGDAAAREGALTPAQAAAEARKLESHPGFRDKHHPEHQAVIERRLKYLNMTA